MCYTGRSPATETYVYSLGNYTVMITFSLIHGTARREIEGSKTRKSEGGSKKAIGVESMLQVGISQKGER